MNKKMGDVILDVNNISLSFGGVKALADISFNVKEHEIRAGQQRQCELERVGSHGWGRGSEADRQELDDELRLLATWLDLSAVA